MEFSLFDAERQLSAQGYLEPEFGGVAATSVIHAARHLVATTFIVSTLLRVIGVGVFVWGELTKGMLEWSSSARVAGKLRCCSRGHG